MQNIDREGDGWRRNIEREGEGEQGLRESMYVLACYIESLYGNGAGL